MVAALTGALGGNASCTWESTGRILIAGTDFGLLAVSSQGGDPEEVLPRNEGEQDFHEVSQLPGGQFSFRLMQAPLNILTDPLGKRFSNWKTNLSAGLFTRRAVT